jgi:AraC-like DNA-binding protein
MNQEIQTLSHAPLQWQDDLPPAFSGVRLPGASMATASGDFGSVCIQEFTTDNYSLRYYVLNILQRFIIRYRHTQKGICSRLVLQGRVDQKAGSSVIPVCKNQFSLHISPSPLIISTFKEKTIYQGLDTFFSHKLCNEIIKDYPTLALSVQKHIPDAGKCKADTHWADADTIEIASNILHCSYQKDLREFYFKSRVRDLFFKYLLQLDTPADSQALPSGREIEAVYKAEQIINEDISAHHIIPELSKKVLLNEFRFKAVFKKIFGMGPYEYLVRQRMKKAKVLLMAGLSVKEVAAETGYRPSDFTTAFIHFYGFTPSSVKNRNS